MSSEVKKDSRVQNTTLILEGRGWGRQGMGIGMSTTQKGAILRKCLNTFVPHWLNGKLCYGTPVGHCMTMILTEIKGINNIIMLLVVGVILTYSSPTYRANSNYVMT